MKKVSVPLRGYGFEICRRISFPKGTKEVSVPLRGYGFEIVIQSVYTISG